MRSVFAKKYIDDLHEQIVPAMFFTWVIRLQCHQVRSTN